MATAVLLGTVAAGALAAGTYKLFDVNRGSQKQPHQQVATHSVAQQPPPPDPERWLAETRMPEYKPPEDYLLYANPNEVQAAPGGGYPPKPRGSPVRNDLLIPRVGDVGRYAYPDLSSPGYADQDWQLDCSATEKCPATPENSGQKPPLDDQFMGRETMTLGDYLPGLQTETRRDAEVELNEPPHPTRRYPDFGLGWGEPLESWNIPHGAQSATDLQFWGPTVWEAERKHKLPSYLFNGAMEADGKEVNRPYDTYFGDFDENDGSVRVEHGTGAYSGRTTNVRLTSLNRYGGIATTKDTIPRLFMPPVQKGSRGMGMAPKPPERSLGARIITSFNAFWPWREGGSKNAPPMMAAIQLPSATRRAGTYEERVGDPQGKTQSYGSEGINIHQGGRMGKRLPFNFWVREGNLPPGGGAPAGPDTNPEMGGAIRKIGRRYDLDDEDGSAGELPGAWDTRNSGGFVYGGVGAGTEQNPPDQGYGYTTQLRITRDGEHAASRGSANGSGPMLFHDLSKGARATGDCGRRPDYQGSQFRASAYGGVDIAGQTFPVRRISASHPFLVGGVSGGGGQGGMPIPRSVWTIGGNMLRGTRGGDFDDSPPQDIGAEPIKSALFKNIIGRRTESELSDVFSVSHS